eukprot:925187-Pelagomonas_calceolata.AAC.6
MFLSLLSFYVSRVTGSQYGQISIRGKNSTDPNKLLTKGKGAPTGERKRFQQAQLQEIQYFCSQRHSCIKAKTLAADLEALTVKTINMTRPTKLHVWRHAVIQAIDLLQHCAHHNEINESSSSL